MIPTICIWKNYLDKMIFSDNIIQSLQLNVDKFRKLLWGMATTVFSNFTIYKYLKILFKA